MDNHESLDGAHDVVAETRTLYIDSWLNELVVSIAKTA